MQLLRNWAKPMNAGTRGRHVRLLFVGVRLPRPLLAASPLWLAEKSLARTAGKSLKSAWNWLYCEQGGNLQHG